MPNVENVEEQFVRVLENKFKNNLMKYFVCKEKHKDDSPHIHVYLEFSGKQEIPSREKLHVEIVGSDEQIKLCEGKYEAVRNTEKTLSYITKDCSEDDYKTNMNIPVVDGKLYWVAEDHFCAALNAYGYEYVENLLVEKYPTLAIRRCSTFLKNLQLMNDIKQKKLRKVSKKIKSLEEFKDIPQDVFEWINAHKTKSLILHGKSGTGKTELAKSIIKHIGKEPVLIRDINALGCENIDSNVGLIFDDISTGNTLLSEGFTKVADSHWTYHGYTRFNTNFGNILEHMVSFEPTARILEELFWNSLIKFPLAM